MMARVLVPMILFIAGLGIFAVAFGAFQLLRDPYFYIPVLTFGLISALLYRFKQRSWLVVGALITGFSFLPVGGTAAFYTANGHSVADCSLGSAPVCMASFSLFTEAAILGLILLVGLGYNWVRQSPREA